jgi:hypothetical protein
LLRQQVVKYGVKHIDELEKLVGSGEASEQERVRVSLAAKRGECSLVRLNSKRVLAHDLALLRAGRFDFFASTLAERSVKAPTEACRATAKALSPLMS